MHTQIMDDWIKNVEEKILLSQDIPLFGNTGPFPLEDLLENLKETLKAPSLSIQTKPLSWQTPKELLQQIIDPQIVNVLFQPLQEEITFIISSSELKKFMSGLFAIDLATLDNIPQDMLDAFYHFIILETMKALDALNHFESLSFSLSLSKQVPKASSFVWSIGAHIDSNRSFAKMALSQNFLKAWKSYRDSFPRGSFPSELRNKISASLGVEIGKTVLSYEELRSIALGDLMLLDRCSFDPETKEGNGFLTFDQCSLFKVSLEQNQIKIIDYPHSQEEVVPMDKKEENEEENNISDEDDFLFDEEEDFLDEEEDISLEEDLKEPSEKDEDLELPEEELVEEEVMEDISDTEIKAPSEIIEETPVGPSNIPLTISVELGQIKMSAGKLLELQIGNDLDFNPLSNNQVDLRVNGKLIAKGELIRVGDVIGVRILSL